MQGALFSSQFHTVSQAEASAIKELRGKPMLEEMLIY